MAIKDEKIYMAGSLFNAGEWRERKREVAILRELINGYDRSNFDIYTPIESPVNDKSTLPTSESIFMADYKELMESTIVFVDISTEDPGVMYELGLIHDNDSIRVYAYDTDIRTPGAGDYQGVRVPLGKNQFCVGGIFVKEGHIYGSFDEALKAFENDFLK